MPVKYEGGRDKGAWTKYVVENSSGLSKEYEIPIKSDPIPEPQGPGEVVTLVGKNFKDIVTEDKNVLVKFYKKITKNKNSQIFVDFQFLV